MSTFYTSVYAPNFPWSGRGDLENHVIRTINDWILYYLGEYERQNGIAARNIPAPPTSESVHGEIDFERFSNAFMPEIAVLVQPTGEVERYDDGEYGAWYYVHAAAFVQVEGDPDRTRALADVYGTCLEALLTQQGAFGTRPDEVTEFATRTRLQEPYGVSYPSDDVRDIIRATLQLRTFVEYLAADQEGPRVPTGNPYATPSPWPTAAKVEVALVRGTPEDSGVLTADAVILDGTVVPPAVEYEIVTVDEPDDD